MTRGLPGGAEESQRLGGQGDVPVLGALAAVDMALEALAVNIDDLEVQGFMEPEAQAIDGGEVDLIMQGGSRLEDTSDFCNTEHRREMVGGLRAEERQRGPVTLQDVLREEADAAVADTHGRGGEAVDILAVEEVRLEFLFGDAVGGFVIALREQVYFTDIGLLGTLPLATALKRSDHVLTQWGHEISPFVS